MDSIECVNCGTLHDSKYCPNCGQKYIGKRYTLKDSIAMVLGQVFNLERGFLFTSREIIVRPGNVIRGFLAGNTMRYFHPFRFVFVWASVSALLSLWLGSFDQVAQYMQFGEQEAEQSKKGMEIVSNYLTLITMAGIPFFALFSFLFYRKSKLNYTEHLIINAYAQGASIILGLVFTGLYFFPPTVPIAIYGGTVLMFVVGGIVLARATATNVLWSIVKYILAFFCALIVIMILSSLGVIIYALITKA